MEMRESNRSGRSATPWPGDGRGWLEVFLDLQRRYADAEESVASARRFYNDAIEVLRTRRGQFPGNLFARFVEVPSWNLFEADDADRAVPRIPEAPAAAPAPELD